MRDTTGSGCGAPVFPHLTDRWTPLRNFRFDFCPLGGQKLARKDGMGTRQVSVNPLFTTLGYLDQPGCLKRYVLEVRGDVRLYRASELLSVNSLLEIHPDEGHWSRNFPSKYYHGNRIDKCAACAAIIRACLEAGPYDLPEHLRPKNGRPKKPA